MGESSVQAPLRLRRRITARAVSPTTIPAMMDSHGKPGIPGSATGVTMEDEDVAWVGVLTTVVVNKEVATEVFG